MNAVAFLTLSAGAVLLPIFISAAWIRYGKGKIFPIIVGGITFFLFVNVLEGIAHTVFLVMDNPISRFLRGSAMAYTMYGAFAAGIFEETGRLIAFKTVLREQDSKKTAVSYGIGHGGMEVILTLGANYALMAAAMLTTGTSAGSSLAPIMESAAFVTPGLVAIAFAERLFAMVFHISASILVFLAARDRRKIGFYLLAIILHAALDIPAALYQSGILPLYTVECFIAIYSVFVAWFAAGVYKKMEE